MVARLPSHRSPRLLRPPLFRALPLVVPTHVRLLTSPTPLLSFPADSSLLIRILTALNLSAKTTANYSTAQQRTPRAHRSWRPDFHPAARAQPSGRPEVPLRPPSMAVDASFRYAATPDARLSPTPDSLTLLPVSWRGRFRFWFETTWQLRVCLRMSS